MIEETNVEEFSFSKEGAIARVMEGGVALIAEAQIFQFMNICNIHLIEKSLINVYHGIAMQKGTKSEFEFYLISKDLF